MNWEYVEAFQEWQVDAPEGLLRIKKTGNDFYEGFAPGHVTIVRKSLTEVMETIERVVDYKRKTDEFEKEVVLELAAEKKKREAMAREMMAKDYVPDDLNFVDCLFLFGCGVFLGAAVMWMFI